MYSNLIEAIKDSAQLSGMYKKPGKLNTVRNYKNSDCKCLEFKREIRKEKNHRDMQKLNEIRKEFCKYLEIKKEVKNMKC